MAEKRVEFFARTGVNWAELKKRLTEKHMAPNDDESTGLLKDLRAVYDSVALPKNMTYGGSQKHRFPRPGEPSRCKLDFVPRVLKIWWKV